jgi:hypothetical protein
VRSALLSISSLWADWKKVRMERSIKRFLASGLFTLAALCLFASSESSAATLNVIGGQLFGAFDVNVGGDLYNVEFLNGTCSSLFSGCDSLSDFAFPSPGGAHLATQALLDQVLIDSPGLGLFDSFPDLTNGCSDLNECLASIPFGFFSNSQTGTANAINDPGAADNPNGESLLSDGFDTSNSPNRTFAVFTPVPPTPVPGLGLLSGLGILVPSLGLTAFASRRRATH